jgi:hypothetical protein
MLTVAAAFTAQVKSAILDAELVAVDLKGKPCSTNYRPL